MVTGDLELYSPPALSGSLPPLEYLESQWLLNTKPRRGVGDCHSLGEVRHHCLLQPSALPGLKPWAGNPKIWLVNGRTGLCNRSLFPFFACLLPFGFSLSLSLSPHPSIHPSVRPSVHPSVRPQVLFVRALVIRALLFGV